jgi:hypothetical protein
LSDFAENFGFFWQSWIFGDFYNENLKEILLEIDGVLKNFNERTRSRYLLSKLDSEMKTQHKLA